MVGMLKKAAFCAAPLLALAALASGPVRAQNGGHYDNVEVREGFLDPQFHRFDIREPIDFVPFEIVDPETGMPVTPDTQLTLPDGTQTTAGEFWDTVNQIEQQLNAIGHSLREEESDTPFLDSRIDETLLSEQSDALDTQSLRLSRPDEIGAQDAEVHRERHWTYAVGDRHKFAASVGGQIKLDGTANGIGVSGNASADISILSHDFNLAKATAAGTYQRASGAWNTSLNVNLVGFTVANFNHGGSISHNFSQRYSKTFSKAVHYHVTLGPVPVEAEIGAQGDIGLVWSVNLVPIKVTASAEPFAHSSGWAKAGVGGSFLGLGAGAGVQGRLTVVDYDGTIRGVLDLWFQSLQRYYFDQTYSYSHNLDMLSGKIELYAYVKYIFGKKTWTHKIFSWNGYRRNETVFNINQRTYFP